MTTRQHTSAVSYQLKKIPKHIAGVCEHLRGVKFKRNLPPLTRSRSKNSARNPPQVSPITPSVLPLLSSGDKIYQPVRDFVIMARIPPAFNREDFRLPMKRSSYKDDVQPEAYQPARLILAGRQRSGIREPIDRCSSFDEHIRRAFGGLAP